MSFDNLENKVTRKANLAVLILLTFLALLVTYFLPFIGFASLAILPVPCILLLLSGRKRDAIICALAGVILLFLLNYILAAVTLILIIAISFDYKYFFNKDRKVLIIIFSIFLIFIGTVILYILMESLAAGSNPLSVVSKAYNVYNGYINDLPNDPIVKIYQSLFSAESGQFGTIMKQTQALLRFFPKLLPGIFCVFFGAASLINYAASTTILGKYDIRLNVLPKFKEWDISWYWCWGIILGIILLIIPKMNSGYDVLIDTIGYNLIIIFGSLYLVLGASILWGIFERFNLITFWRYFILIMMILTPGFILFLPVIGLIDIWANLRKLNRS